MLSNRKRGLPWALVAMGVVMTLCALAMLSQTRCVLQYAVIAPDAEAMTEAAPALEKAREDLVSSLKNSAGWITMGGYAASVNLSAGDNTASASLFAMGEGWNEVYPQFVRSGRRAAENELASGASVIVLDEDLAFRLFGSEPPDDAEVQLNGARWRVIGTVRHGGSLLGGRGVGDVEPCDAYIPLAAAARVKVPLDTLLLSVVPLGDIPAASKSFGEAARQGWKTGGTLIDLQKEAMRRTVLPRVLLFIAGLYLLSGLFVWMTRVTVRRFERFSEALRNNYMKTLLPRLVALVLLTVFSFAALVAAACLLMVFSAQPLFRFAEWVPENIVSWRAITNVFWNLTSDAAVPVRVGTRELRVVEFWGGLLRWGVVLALLGGAMMPRRAARRPEAE